MDALALAHTLLAARVLRAILARAFEFGDFRLHILQVFLCELLCGLNLRLEHIYSVFQVGDIFLELYIEWNTGLLSLFWASVSVL